MFLINRSESSRNWPERSYRWIGTWCYGVPVFRLEDLCVYNQTFFGSHRHQILSQNWKKMLSFAKIYMFQIFSDCITYEFHLLCSEKFQIYSNYFDRLIMPSKKLFLNFILKVCSDTSRANTRDILFLSNFSKKFTYFQSKIFSVQSRESF